MNNNKKLRLKKFYFHPITTVIFLTLALIILSAILSGLEMQATYDTINANTKELIPKLVTVNNMLTFDGFKYIISSATKNFISFAPFAMLLISLIGLSTAEATGLIETFSKKFLKPMAKPTLTFLIIFIATISSLINEVGYAILIPLVALIYFINGRNPILGIITAFCGVAFGYGVSIFVGTTEIELLTYTKQAARLIDSTAHVSLTSNLIFIIVTSILLSIIGTIVIEKLIAPKVGKYKKEEAEAKTEEYKLTDLDYVEQETLEKETNEKRGLKFAIITAIIIGIAFIYMLIPNLPYSGLLLDMEENAYVNQLFGDNSYFQDGFTYMISLFFFATGIAYGLGAHSIKNNNKLIDTLSNCFSKIGSVIILLFVSSQFIAIFKQTNIGTVITAWLANLLSMLNFSSIPLIITTIILIAISNFLLTGSANKWVIFAPIVVPMFMQSNISPAFAQIVMRAGDSITNGYTPLMASFAIYIGYLNIYNLNKNKPYTIKKSLSIIRPYFIIIALAWIAIIIGWYITGLPIGPNVYPTL